MADEILDDAQRSAERFHKGPLPEETTPLMKVAIVNSDPREVFTVLEDPAVRATINAQNKAGMTALLYAVQAGKIDIAIELVKAGADSKLKNNEGNDAIEMLKNLPLSAFDEDDDQVAMRMRTRALAAMKGGKRKRFSTKRKSKRNVRARVRYSRRRA